MIILKGKESNFDLYVLKIDYSQCSTGKVNHLTHKSVNSAMCYIWNDCWAGGSEAIFQNYVTLKKKMVLPPCMTGKERCAWRWKNRSSSYHLHFWIQIKNQYANWVESFATGGEIAGVHLGHYQKPEDTMGSETSRYKQWWI